MGWRNRGEITQIASKSLILKQELAKFTRKNKGTYKRMAKKPKLT